MMTSQLGPAIPQLPSGNIDETEVFFHSQLGFATVLKLPGPGFLIVRRGGAEIQFWQTATVAEAREWGSISSCYIRVAQIEGIFQEFKTRGARFRYELEIKPWGMNEMQIDDPFGNAIRFGEPVIY